MGEAGDERATLRPHLHRCPGEGLPPDLVDRVVAEAGRKEVRHRLLPARVVVYYVLGLALFADAS